MVVKQLLEMAEGFREKGVLKKAMEVYRCLHWALQTTMAP